MSDVEPIFLAPDDEVLALNEALEKLAAQDKRKADVVKLRFFAGLTNKQVAQALNISISTAENDWAYARSWLRLAVGGESPS
jgi:RNA polymerase sigma factor (sigma-70 family)